MKKGVFFTIDALLASGIIIIAIVLISNFYYSGQQATNVNYASKDIVNVFSAMTVNGVDNEYVKSLIASGLITNTNNTLIEQIGDFWADDNIGLAENFTKNLTEDIIPKNYGFSVLVDGDEIYSRNIPVAKSLVSTRKIISGIAKAKPTNGYTARVLLSGIKSKKTSAYTYFGGYEGDGNLTKKLILPNDVLSFNSSYIEIDAGGNFNLYINNVFSGSYAKGSSGGGNMLADKWNLSSAYLSNFRAGENTININFTSVNSYIAGGFIKVSYTTSSYNDTQVPGYDKYLFPGITGNINLYSSIYVPNTLNNMKVFLNYSSNYTTFLKLGNITIYQGSSNGTRINITLSNSTLSSLLDYSSIIQKTIPLRLGIINATNFGGTADAVLVSDVSGSMDWCSKVTSETWEGWQSDSSRGCYYWFGSWLWGSYSFTPNYGYSNYNRTIWYNGTDNLCGCRYNTVCQNDARKLDIYINSSMQFVNTIFNITGNRAGLVEFTDNAGIGYRNSCSGSSPTTVPFPDSIVRFTNITNNKQGLIKNISNTTAWWGTCTCCGINKAVGLINSQNNPSRKDYIVVMSDGAANVGCTQQPNSTAIADAVQASWDACNSGISVYTIAFGADADSASMQRMNCSGGKFFDATDTTQLQQAYSAIAGDINRLSFSGQIINVSSLATSSVYPSSYIEFNYTIPNEQFNKLPLSFESDRFGNNISTGTLTIYPNSTASNSKITSYSESYWTDNAVINGNNIYRLSDYGNEYTNLGDPFTVDIPASYINTGDNSITISTGKNSTYNTNGSSDDKVIYTLLLNGFADYSNVVSESNGCSWILNFEDGSTSTVNVPSTYSGGSSCSYSLKTYDADDALNNAAFQLFNNLDLDKDGRLDVNIDSSSLNFNTLTVSKVPSLWGPAIIEIRVWE